ncbi:DL-endopeptidase inhibitor IseA family protein [Paenibacillus sanfengchensis]|uniref:DL-endopeptidase inhibitor IseA family protein n=1 Tax=Paenibacillus sanfengchensis TaxID=3119819 RepID=UPI002FE1B5A6
MKQTRLLLRIAAVVILLVAAVGCSSKSAVLNGGPSNGQKDEAQENTAKQPLSLEEAQKRVLETERVIKELKEREVEDKNSPQIGYFGVSPIYGKFVRSDLENELSAFFSRDILVYVLATHEIFCSPERCGNYGDSEGQYFVDSDGNFKMVEQTADRTVIEVPFKFEGIDENGTFTDSPGIYTFSRQEDGYRITDISQEYNDELYKKKDPSELLVTPEDEMGWGTDDVDDGDNEIPPLDGDAALKLRDEGVATFFTVFYDGGKKCKPLEERQIGDDPLGYYFFCDDMNTKEKIREYLEPSFADALITEWVDSDIVVEQDGKLVYRPYDVGALTDWDKAKLSRVVVDERDKKVFEYDVPEAEGESRLIQVPFIYENQKWKLNAHPVDFL